MNDRIVFLCPHGAAKSIMAAAYCRALADEHNLQLEIIAAGTEPDIEISPAVIEFLRAGKLVLLEKQPRRVTQADLQNASHIISMGCNLESLLPAHRTASAEDWSDVPSPGQDLILCYHRIRFRVQTLIAPTQQTRQSHAR